METLRFVCRSVLLPALVAGMFLGLYLAAYRTIGTRAVFLDSECQFYQHKWQTYLFAPAVKIESFLRQEDVDVVWVTLND